MIDEIETNIEGCSLEQAALWGPGGLDWLGRELFGDWDGWVESAVEAAWDRPDRLMRGYPDHTLAFLLRAYACGDLQSLRVAARRLRQLIPALAVGGDQRRVLPAMALLALVDLDSVGLSDEVEAIADYAMAELEPHGLGLGTVLALLLAARVGTMRDGSVEGSELAQRLFALPTGSDPLVVSAMGLAYLRLASMVWRERSSLQTSWRLAVSSWLASAPKSRMRCMIASIVNGLDGLSSDERGDTHPVVAWHRKRHDVDSSLWDSTLEYWVIQATLRARAGMETPDRARHLALQLGDPFWIRMASDVGASLADQPPLVASEPHIQVSEPAMPEMRFTFFEGFQGTFDTGTFVFPPRFRRKKVKQIVALLLLQPRYRMVKDQLIQELFGDVDEDVGGNHLHVTLYRARQHLCQQAGRVFDAIRMQDGMVALNEMCIPSVDVEAYRKRASVGHQLWSVDKVAAVELYVEAVQQYRPTVAPEFEYEEFMVKLRSELEGTQRRMLQRVVGYERDFGEIERVIHFNEQRYGLDPWDTDILYELCQDWKAAGEAGRMRQAVREAADGLRQEGEPLPTWMRDVLDANGVIR